MISPVFLLFPSTAIIINADILKLDLNQIVEEHNQGRPVKVVANLPYYITTPIIMALFENHIPLQSVTVMVQKEVANAAIAQTCPSYYHISPIFTVLVYHSHISM